MNQYWILLKSWFIASSLFISFGACTPFDRSSDNTPANNTATSVAEVANTTTSGFSTDGYARVLDPRTFQFPQDHGAHPNYQAEWWYVTGNVTTTNQRHFGFQITFFRFALTAKPQVRTSQWASSQVYMAHLALTDVQNNQYYAFERFARASALDLAGAQTTPFRVWLGPWELLSESSTFFPLRLQAVDGNIQLDLQLIATKPVALQGKQGLSQKGQQVGDASYYYSLTRLATQGSIKIDNETLAVTGWSWMDREWFTPISADRQLGWDWFSLQLSNQEELMFYRIREDNKISPYSSGTYVDALGTTRQLFLNDVEINAISTWTSPLGTEYPQGWHFSVPSEGIALEIHPYQANQEMNHSQRYWEGAVKITGTKHNQSISGNGYIELVGYAEQ